MSEYVSSATAVILKIIKGGKQKKRTKAMVETKCYKNNKGLHVKIITPNVPVRSIISKKIRPINTQDTSFAEE